MCFSGPSAPPAAAPIVAAPAKKTPAEIKAKAQKAAETVAVESNKQLAKQKNRKSFRIQLGGYSGSDRSGGSGLSL